MPLDVSDWIDFVWMLVGIFWAVGVLRSKPVARRQKLLPRLFHLAMMAAVLGLLFSNSTRIGFLGVRLIPKYSWIGWAGLCCTVAGCVFAVWARALLGSNWSSTVTVKEHHELIRSGPYGIVRHPIYAGLLLGIFGTALALGELRGVIALALAVVAWFRKARAEEEFLVGQFGITYICYCHKVKQLIPFVL
jgi:protein-S-isoprenylcysteine O-methyltransferase Ste14